MLGVLVTSVVLATAAGYGSVQGSAEHAESRTESNGMSLDGLGTNGGADGWPFDGLGTNGGADGWPLDGLGTNGGAGVSNGMSLDGLGTNGGADGLLSLDGLGTNGGSDAPRIPQSVSIPSTRYSFLIPALETFGSQLVLLAFNNVAFPEEWSLVSFDRIHGNLVGTYPWEFDVDIFETNQLGHPYQGAIYFTSARSSGLSFWTSALYTLVGSFVWEVAMENEPPSINDQITTTLGGIFLGEALHRAYRALLDEPGPPSFTRSLTAAALSPVSAINRWIYGGELGSNLETPSRLHGAFNAGVSMLGRFGTRDQGILINHTAQLFLSGELTYGAYGVAQAQGGPFSFFHVEGAITAPTPVTGQLYIRGLLAGSGWRFGRMDTVAGLFGLYDFGANNVVRVSSVGVGPGAAVELFAGEKNRFRATLIAAAVGFGAAGTVEDVEVGARDYRIGPGAQAVIDLEWARKGLGKISLRSRYWQLTRFYLEPVPGNESVLYTTAAISWWLNPRFALSLEVPVYLRNFGVGQERDVAFGSGPRLFATVLSGEAF